MPDRDPRSDAELAGAAGRGDAVAFEALYRRHRDWVVRIAWRIAGDRHLALDVLQETFLYLLDRIPTLRLTARLTTFLYPAVRHLAIRAREKAGRTAGGEATLDGVPAPPPAPAGASEDLRAAVAGLPADQQETLLLRFVDDMTIAEIAAALGIPEGTVKSRLHNALRTLRADPRARVLLSG